MKRLHRVRLLCLIVNGDVFAAPVRVRRDVGSISGRFGPVRRIVEKVEMGKTFVCAGHMASMVLVPKFDVVTKLKISVVAAKLPYDTSICAIDLVDGRDVSPRE